MSVKLFTLRENTKYGMIDVQLLLGPVLLFYTFREIGVLKYF